MAINNVKIQCPFCDKGALIPGTYHAFVSFQCSHCNVIVSFRESFEELKPKLACLKNLKSIPAVPQLKVWEKEIQVK